MWFLAKFPMYWLEIAQTMRVTVSDILRFSWTNVLRKKKGFPIRNFSLEQWLARQVEHPHPDFCHEKSTTKFEFTNAR